MERILRQHRDLWRRREFLASIFVSIIFLALSLVLNHITSTYTDESTGPYVQDILLDNIPVVNVNFVVNEVVWALIYFVLFLLVLRPSRIPLVAKNVALFIFIRSLFTVLTHLGSIPDHSFLSQRDYLSGLATGHDMFFSGHTGMPFLFALLFWKERWIRFVFLAFSVVFGVSMILGHLHYSIDVFAAFFITYGIAHLGKWLFSYEHALFHDAKSHANAEKL